MINSPARPCLDCRQPTRRGARCDACAARHEKLRHNPAYDDPAWKRLSAFAIAKHVAVHGWVCPGYGRPAHPSHDLTADHPVALVRGGDLLAQRPNVLCRGCNGRKGAR